VKISSKKKTLSAAEKKAKTQKISEQILKNADAVQVMPLLSNFAQQFSELCLSRCTWMARNFSRWWRSALPRKPAVQETWLTPATIDDLLPPPPKHCKSSSRSALLYTPNSAPPLTPCTRAAGWQPAVKSQQPAMTPVGAPVPTKTAAKRAPTAAAPTTKQPPPRPQATPPPPLPAPPAPLRCLLLAAVAAP
jgi:hypothetical protein